MNSLDVWRFIVGRGYRKSGPEEWHPLRISKLLEVYSVTHERAETQACSLRDPIDLPPKDPLQTRYTPHTSPLSLNA